MTIEADVAQALKNYPALDSIIGGRVYPNRAPANVAPPLVVYQRISTTFQLAMGDTIAAEDSRIQLSMWAQTDEVAAAGAAEVIQAVLGMGVDGTRHVKAHVIDTEDADWDETANLHRRIIDVILVSVAAA